MRGAACFFLGIAAVAVFTLAPYVLALRHVARVIQP